MLPPFHMATSNADARVASLPAPGGTLQELDVLHVPHAGPGKPSDLAKVTLRKAAFDQPCPAPSGMCHAAGQAARRGIKRIW